MLRDVAPLARALLALPGSKESPKTCDFDAYHAEDFGDKIPWGKGCIVRGSPDWVGGEIPCPLPV